MIKMQKIMNAEVAEILGAFTGDGWMQSDLEVVYICGHSINDKEYYDKHLGPLFSKCFSEVKIRKFPYWHVYGISLFKRDIIKDMLALGFQKGKKCYSVTIPEWILKGDISLQKAFLRGLFDTDGSFWCEKSNANTSVEWKRTHKYIPRTSITSCSKKLLEQCEATLDTLNIKCTLKHKNKEGVLCNRNVHNSYALLIDKKVEIEKFFMILMPSNPKHNKRYCEWKDRGFL